MSDERRRNCTRAGDVHQWPAPSAPGERCACGAMVIVMTIATGTWSGATVTDWRVEAVKGEADR